MGGWATLSKMFLERLLCSQGTLGRGRPIVNRKPKTPGRLEVLSGRFLPGPAACLCPAFPQRPGGGRLAPAIAAPRRPGGRPRGCHLQAAGPPGRRVAPQSRPGPLFTFGRSSPRAAPPRSPGGSGRNLPPLPPAAALAPHSSGLSNNFPSEGGWAGARGAQPGPRCFPPPPRRGSRCRARRAAASPCPQEPRLPRGWGGVGSRGRRPGCSSEFPPACGRIARAPGGCVGLTLALIVELVVPADRPVWRPARGEHAKFASRFCSNSEGSLTTERGGFGVTTEERS